MFLFPFFQNHPLNEEELSLFAMNPPNPETDMINAKWIRSTEEKIASLVKQVQVKMFLSFHLQPLHIKPMYSLKYIDRVPYFYY